MQSDKSDIDIIKGMREGKVSAFRDLYTRYSNLIYRNILVRLLMRTIFFRIFLFRYGRKESRWK